MTAEIAVVASLAKHPFEYQRAFGCIPKNMRMMFIHAVQSLIWNKAVSYRLSQMGPTSPDGRRSNSTQQHTVLVGDLVPNTTTTTTSKQGGDGDQEKGETATPSSSSSSSSSNSKVHIVTQDDIDAKTYTMEDVVIPVVGTKTIFPTNALGGILHQYLTEFGLSVENFKTCQDREIRANGDYRQAIVRPHDFTYTIQEYYHPLQPLLPTDLMKLNQEDIVIEQPPASSSNKEGHEAEDNEQLKTEDTASVDKVPPEQRPVASITKKPLIAMVVGFTLQTSSYATIALRELMKSPTSNEYQSKLQLE